MVYFDEFLLYCRLLFHPPSSRDNIVENKFWQSIFLFLCENVPKKSRGAHTVETPKHVSSLTKLQIGNSEEKVSVSQIICARFSTSSE